MKNNPQLLTFIWSLSLLFTGISKASEWLRLNHPDEATKLASKDQGLHYENFIFIQREHLNDTAISGHVVSLNRPFQYRIDESYLDLKQASHQKPLGLLIRRVQMQLCIWFSSMGQLSQHG